MLIPVNNILDRENILDRPLLCQKMQIPEQILAISLAFLSLHL